MPPQGLKPRVFISHSAHQDEARKVQKALNDALELSGKYEVLLDVETLQVGDGWRSLINHWLGACDAAIVLLSEDALKSAYVAYEASILAYRKEVLTPSLLLLPVLLGDVSPESFEKSHLSPARLPEWQAVRGTPEQIVEKILERLKEVQFHELTPIERQAKKVADLLRGIPEDVLEEAANELSFRLPLAGANPRIRLAIQLLSVSMPDALRALQVLRPELPAAQQTDKMRRLIDRIASSWVDLRCVGRIPRIAKGKEPVRAFGINVTRWDTARMYVVCASHEDADDQWRAQSCPGVFGEDFPEALVREVREVLKNLMNSPSEEELAEDLKAYHEAEQPVIVGLERHGIDDAVLSRLRSEFPHVTFFLMMGPKIEAGAPLSDALVEMLFPRLLEKEEETFQKQYQTFERALRYRPGGI